ncbi:MAG: tRNA uridine-5-carboxymethylaminomethyl(34) synthesis GTPase MnmE [Candidatus Omnitrophica bacterium]|nr:tRNA uridine-5-carboxymethylaminomethyl(34) synthesis GTPase MnmE [Candidatus Omnitrophota bacterium]
MLRESEKDTIVAISTPPGEGGIGIVRLSGDRSLPIADEIFAARSGKKAEDQKNFTARVGHAMFSGPPPAVIDEALLLVMRAPKSYTGEDMAEISAHGGTRVLEAIVESAVQAGARPAGPGEFTKRAFLNGRMDLVQAEAVLDLIRAKTELARRWAASQLEGTLTQKVRAVQDRLVEALSHLEAAIDFPDDEVRPARPSEMQNRLREICGELADLLAGSRMGILAKQGLRAVITGRPNVGKSSLMNGLLRSPRVIVTSYPGTTRDVVEETVQVHGFPVHLADTAGIQETEHPVEKEGIERSKKAIERADLILFVLDGSRPLSAEDKKLLELLPEDTPRVLVLNKSDLSGQIKKEDLKNWAGAVVLETSCLLGKGFEELGEEIFRIITKGKMLAGEPVAISSLRQKDLVEKALGSAKRAAESCRDGLSAEFCAADVRVAIGYLGEIVGDVVTDDVLNVLFSQFCIGK